MKEDQGGYNANVVDFKKITAATPTNTSGVSQITTNEMHFKISKSGNILTEDSIATDL